MSRLTIRSLRVILPANGEAVTPVRGVDLDVAEGEVVALVGESGGGKSTFLASIIGLLPAGAALSGAILYDGVDLLQAGRGALAGLRGGGIGILWQDSYSSFDPLQKVGRHAREVLTAHGINGAMDAKVQQLFLRVGLDPAVADLYPHQLSGGMLQRVALALAIAPDPELLLLDEPTSALDPPLRSRFVDLMLELLPGRSVLIATHDLRVVERLQARIVVMYSGRVIEQGVSVDRLRHPYSRALVQAARFVGAGLEGAAAAPSADGEGCAFRPRCADAIPRCDCEDPPLVAVDSGLCRCHVHA